MTRVFPTNKTTATDVGQIFVDHWVIPFDIPKRLLTDIGPQLVGKVFNDVCAALGAKLMTTNAYHPQTNGQTKRYNETIVS